MGLVMKDVVKYAKMLDIYGGILTQKQYDMLDSYYCSDLTMEEIAQNYEISKAAVHYAIKNAEDKIQKLEVQLHIMEKYDTVKKMSEKLKQDVASDKLSKNDICEALDRLTEKL